MNTIYTKSKQATDHNAKPTWARVAFIASCTLSAALAIYTLVVGTAVIATWF